MKNKCIGCGGLFVAKEGDTHAYMLSSPGCWERYGYVLAREYQAPDIFASTHRFTVDAYALQHPGLENERRAYQSVRLHFMSLHLVFAYGKTHAEATRALQALASQSFEPLPSRPANFDLTVNDIYGCELSAHADMAKAWARSAYESWSDLIPYADETLKTLRLV